MSASTRPSTRRRTEPPRRSDFFGNRDTLILVPLRLFLGVTFIYAGLQKLTDRWFFKASAPSSLQSQLHAAARTSPIGGVAGAMSHVAVPLGLVIAFGELAVGLGALLG